MKETNKERPNIIMIIVHDLGQHLGCYGAGLKTPNLDKHANTGIRFDNFFATAAQCSPSRGSIMTGKYPHNNGLVGLAHIGWEIKEKRGDGRDTELINFNLKTKFCFFIER